MTEYSDFRLIDGVEELLKKSKTLRQNMLKHTRELMTALEGFEQDYQQEFPQNDIRINDIIDAQRHLSKLELWRSNTLSLLDRLFWCMYEYDFRDQLKQLERISPKADCEIKAENAHIKVRLYDGALYVKAPPVFTNFNHMLPVNGRLIQKNYAGFYSYGLAAVMQEYYDQCSCLGPRNINILAVYEKTARHIPDTINLDFKMMIDAITNEMPGGDQWNYCSFSMTSTVSDVLERGVYFTVTEGFGRTPDFKKNLKNLISLFGENGQ